MAMEMNRRTFLKTTAAAAVAVSMTGLLGGCGEAEPLRTVQLPGYAVSLMNIQVNTLGGDSSGVELAAVIKLEYTSSGFVTDNFSNVFSAKLGETPLDLQTKGQVFAGNTFLNRSQTCTLTFRKEAAGLSNLYENGTPVVLDVKLQNQVARFERDIKNNLTAKMV